MKQGLVTKSTGSWYDVLVDKKNIPSRIRGKFRLEGKKVTNPVAVGDQVMIEIDEASNTGLIKKILERENFVVRQSPRQKHSLHLLASNIDLAVLVTTIKEPALKPGFIDRFLLTTEGHSIPVLIVINKVDILDEEGRQMFDMVKLIYESIGYDVLGVSAINGQGIDELKEKIQNKISLFSGQSGVGKSTLLNIIQPNLGIKTQDISGYSGKGAHTTTYAEMHFLDQGGAVIDSPGIKNLSFNNLSVQDVAHNFREFFILSEDCKFGDCTHRNEPKCAVKNALEKGEIFPLRYQNYLQIIDEIEDQNSWERIQY